MLPLVVLLVMSRMDYCNSTLAGTSSVTCSLCENNDASFTTALAQDGTANQLQACSTGTMLSLR